MDLSVCKLTVVCPPAAADNLVELMLGLDPPVAGFTTFAAEGHGTSFDAATVSERVRGRVKRSVIVAVLPRSEADKLVEMVRREMAVPHMSYWIEPVLACGRMGDRPAEAGGLAGSTISQIAGVAR